MKKKNKLSRIGSALLAITLALGMAAANVEPVHAAEDSSTIDVSENKTELDGEAVFNFFGLGGGTVTADENGVVKADDVKIDVTGTATEVIKANDVNSKSYRTVQTSNDVTAVNTSNTSEESKPGLLDSIKEFFSGDSKAASPMEYTVNGDTITITSIGTDSLAQGSTLFTDIAEAEYIRHIKFTTAVDIPANAFKGSKVVTVTGPINSIGESAFYNCHDLESIDLSQCKTIGKKAFSGDELGNLSARYGLNQLTSIDLTSCTNIGEDAFAFNEQLIYITAPTGSCTISANAFKLGYAYVKSEGDKETYYYSTSPATDKGEQVFTRTYFIGTATGSNYAESIWKGFNREIIWDDTSVDFVLSSSYVTGAVPTNDDFEVYITYDQGEPGKYNPAIDSSLNRSLEPQKVAHTTTIINVPAEGGGTGSNYKISFQYQRTSGTSTKTYTAIKYLNTIARTLTDNVAITATDSYPEGTKGLISFEWTDSKNEVTLPYYIKSGTNMIEATKQGMLIPVADTDVTISLHRTQAGAAEATFTISAAPTTVGNTQTWQLNVKNADIPNGTYTASNLASSNAGTEIPFIKFSVKTNADDSSGENNSSEVGEGSLILSGKFVGKDGSGIDGIKLIITNSGGEPLTPIATTAADGSFSFKYDNNATNDPRLYVLNDSYNNGTVFSNMYKYYWTIDLSNGKYYSYSDLTGIATGVGNWTSGNVDTKYSRVSDTLMTCTIQLNFDPKESNDNKYQLKGKFVDKNGDPVPNLRLIQTTGTGTPATDIIRTDENGEFDINLRTGAGVTTRLFVLNSNYVKGDVFDNCWHARWQFGVTETSLNAPTTSVSGEGFWTRDNVSTNYSYRVDNHCIGTLNVRLGFVAAEAGDDPTTPDTPTWSDKVTVTGYYKDVNGNPISNKYIALDTWDNAVFADKNGKFSFTISDEKSHQVFFTNLNEKAANNAFNADDVVASVSFSTSKNADGNLAATVNEEDSKLTSNSATAAYKNSGSSLTINVDTKSVNDDNEIAIGIDNMTLKSIKVSLDGVEGTEFEPYIDRVLTKDDFEVIAVYEYYKANGDQDPVATEYTTGLETKDWSSDKLTSEGLKVTGKEQSILFRYTYKGNTAEEVVKIKGSVQPVAEINGILKDANGKGMGNYVCYLDTYDNSVMTDADGEFVFDNVVDGTYKLYVTKSKKASTSVGEVSSSIDTWLTTTVTIQNGKPQASSTKNGDGVTSVNKVRDNVISFTIVYDPDTTTKVNVRGTFKSSEDKAVTDQYIVLDDWNNAVKADSSGAFSFNDLESGTYVLHFTNKNSKGSGSLGSSDYDYAKVNITISQDSVQAKTTTYDGTTCDATVEDGDIVITVKLSETAEQKGTSNDTPTNQNTANSKVTAGEGKVEIKGTVTDANGTGKQGLAVVIDDYSKAIDTSSSGTFSITGVEDGSHTVAIHNVDKSKLATSGNVNVSDDKVLVSYNVTVANGKVSAQSVGTNNVGTYAFSKESDDTILNITTSLKAESDSTTTNTTTTSDGTTQTTTTGTSLLPKTGLDFLEQTGITDGIAKVVGYDSPIVAMLTPVETDIDENGNVVPRVRHSVLTSGDYVRSYGVIGIIVVLIGAAVSAFIIIGKKRKDDISEG